MIGLELIEEDFQFDYFKQIFKKSWSKIKFFLLDQFYVVGLGNIYVDEVFW